MSDEGDAPEAGDSGAQTGDQEDSWLAADAPVPAVAEMRALLKRL